MPFSPDFVIRRARRDDAPDLGSLGGMLLRAHYEFDPQRFLAPGDDPESGYAWFLVSQLEDEEAVVFVAERRGAMPLGDSSAAASGSPGASNAESSGSRDVQSAGASDVAGSRINPALAPGADVRNAEEGGWTDPVTASGEVVGYVYAGLEPLSWKELRGAAGFIHDVVVSADARGHGVATMLVDAAIEWLRGKGAPRVMLWTAEKNADAQRLFTRLGFRRTMIEMTREL